MKFVLVLLVVLALVWLVRGSRGRGAPPKAPSSGRPTPLQDMVACAQCGVHLPSGEALTGRGGVFCSEAHRAAFEKAHAAS